MFNLKNIKKTDPSALEAEIARVFEEMHKHDISSKEYDAVSDQLAKLYKLKEIDSKKLVSKDMLLGAATNIAGILLIINYEHAHVLTSKALAILKK